MRTYIVSVTYLVIFSFGQGLVAQKSQAVPLNELRSPVALESIHPFSDNLSDHSLIRRESARIKALDTVPVALTILGGEDLAQLRDGSHTEKNEVQGGFGKGWLTILLAVITVLFILRGAESGGSS